MSPSLLACPFESRWVRQSLATLSKRMYVSDILRPPGSFIVANEGVTADEQQ